MTVNQRLLDLLDSADFDWDNERHREAYLKAWVQGVFRREPESGSEEEA